FEDTDADNLLRYVDMHFADGASEAIRVENARLTLEGGQWTDTDEHVLYVDHPRLLVTDSVFPPADGVEPINGQSLEEGDFLVLRRNTFNAASGYNDIIDFSDCKRPGPVLEVYDNLFLGGSDDGLDIDGCDAHVEGNTFIGFHKGHGGSSTSNAIATGFRFGRRTDLVVVRNVFVDNDHAILLKEGTVLWADQNVFYRSTVAAVNFSEWPDRDVEPGSAAYFSGNIFSENAAIFENRFSRPGYDDPTIEVHRSLLPASSHAFGEGNVDGEPLFANPPDDLTLVAGSPAIATGPLGMDMGSHVPSGAWVAGPEDPVLDDGRLVLRIGGPGIAAYRYAVNDTSAAAWSAPIDLATSDELVLDDLAPGSYTIYVQGQSHVGVWQSEPQYAIAGPYEVTGTTAAEPSTLPDADAALEVFPNPVAGSATIRLGPAISVGTVEIYDLLGRLVDRIATGVGASTRDLHWDTRHLAPGVYVVSVTAGKQRTRRVVVRVE
ncbi:MAG TPA: T9SS type A sorting domain-containing protein, partial [Rhodothermales bacterium]